MVFKPPCAIYLVVKKYLSCFGFGTLSERPCQVGCTILNSTKILESYVYGYDSLKFIDSFLNTEKSIRPYCDFLFHVTLVIAFVFYKKKVKH